MDANLYTIFAARFPADRGRPLLILDSGREVSYAEAEATSARYAALPLRLSVVGGCCGTDHRHVAAIADSVRESQNVLS